MIYDLLFPYQQKIASQASQKDVTGLFMDTGTGKTITSLAIFEQKIAQNKCKKLMIICLHSKLYEWEVDCNKYFPFSRILVMDGTKKVTKEQKMKNRDFDILIINFEKVWRHKDLLMIDNSYFILVDESHVIKSPTSQIGKFMRLLGMKTPYKTILTATPMCNGYIDVYNQFYFLGLLDMNLYKFKNDFCIEKNQYNGMRSFKKIIGYKNTDLLDSISKQYCFYYERILDNDLIPEEIVVPFRIDKLYYKIAKERVYKDIVLDNTASKRVGLKSLCSGTLMGKALCDVNGDVERLYQLNDDKIEWVKEFAESYKDRIIVYYAYTHQREQLYNELIKTGRTVARYCNKYKEKDKYLNNDDTILLIQYNSGSTGIDWLSNSNVCIFYSLPDPYLHFKQAKGRINRIGQTKKALYYILVSDGKNSVDMLNYEALQNNQDFNDDYFERNFSTDQGD